MKKADKPTKKDKKIKKESTDPFFNSVKKMLGNDEVYSKKNWDGLFEDLLIPEPNREPIQIKNS